MYFRLRREEQTLNNIKQYYVLCRGRDEKYQAVLNLYSGLTVGSSIIFCHVSDNNHGDVPSECYDCFRHANALNGLLIVFVRVSMRSHYYRAIWILLHEQMSSKSFAMVYTNY